MSCHMRKDAIGSSGVVLAPHTMPIRTWSADDVGFIVMAHIWLLSICSHSWL